jgi:tetratricopeptide (TPR) repeat protein
MAELENILYISVPEGFDRTIGDFRVDPEIMLPVEVKESVDNFHPTDLSWEQIISGMLKILGHQPNHEHSDYYRRFVQAAKPELVQELTETGIFKAKNGDFDVAEEIFAALSGLVPGDDNVELNRALLYEQRADAYDELGKEELASHYTDKAFEVYQNLLSKNTAPVEVYFNAGFFFLKQRNYERARDQFAQYIDEGEDETKIAEAQRVVSDIDAQQLMDRLFKEAYDFIRLGKEREGIEKIQEFLQKNPSVWNAWFLLGWAHRRLGEYEQARDAFLKAIEQGSDEVDTLNELSICLMELGDLAESKRRLEQAVPQEPENTKVLSNLGIVAMKQGELEEASGYFHTVLELAPEDEIARHYLDLIQEQS